MSSSEVKGDRKVKRLRKFAAGALISVMLFSLAILPTRAYADAATAAAVYALTKWMENQMMSEMHQWQEEQTDKITGKMWDIFQKQAGWEAWPATLQELMTEKMVPMEAEKDKISYTNVKSYVNYTQGSASGFDAQQYPVKTLNDFNSNYQRVQNLNPQCEIDVPQSVGDTTNGCTPAQIDYTNTMLTGVNPIPKYPDTTLKTAVGQQYTAETKTSVTRTALSQLALDEATNKGTTDFVAQMQTALQTPTLAQINAESPAAIARDSLIISQARAMLALREYESSLMNERLLATVVAQNEANHLAYIRQLGERQAQALHG
jgi:hypothetical protein